MLNGDFKKTSIAQFKKAQEQYEALSKKIGIESEKLMVLRKNNSNEIIINAEHLFSAIANKPKDFDKVILEYRAEYKTFTNALAEIQENARKFDIQAGSNAGITIAALTPTAAMTIATTFGTVSTKTIISTLARTATTNASLAWLGGGTLIVGGGGLVTGSALLALAGPIGLTIAGKAILGRGLLTRSKNAKIARETDEKRREVEVLNRQFSAILIEIKRLVDETTEHINGIKNLISILDSTLTTLDFNKLGQSQISLMIAIKNHVESLSLLIKNKIEL